MKFFEQTLARSAARRCTPARWATWFLAAATGGVAAQTTHLSIEPNQTKAEATLVTEARSGDQFLTSFPFPSFFRIRTVAAPLGIYRCELWPHYAGPVLSNFGVVTLRGRTAVTDAVDPTSDVVLQTMGTPQTFDRFLAWYGFGKSEEVYADLAVAFYARLPYPSGADLVITAAPEVDLGVLPEQPLELVAWPMTGAQDLELAVFDTEFNALPYASLDDSSPGTGSPRLQFDAPPGLYHIAVADREAASHLAPSALDLRAQSSVLDFAGAFACGSSERLFSSARRTAIPPRIAPALRQR